MIYLEYDSWLKCTIGGRNSPYVVWQSQYIIATYDMWRVAWNLIVTMTHFFILVYLYFTHLIQIIASTYNCISNIGITSTYVSSTVFQPRQKHLHHGVQASFHKVPWMHYMIRDQLVILITVEVAASLFGLKL